MPILQLASPMPGNYGYSLKLLPVLNHGWKRVWTQLPKLWYFSTGNKIMEPQSRSNERSDICLHIYEGRTVVDCQQFDGFWLVCFFLMQTWVKFSSLSGHSGGGILQLVGCRGACAIHAVGSHVSPVSGGRIILGILVLAKCCVWGVLLQRITWIMSTQRAETKG